MTQDEIKHLEFIQALITRMNSNSFQIKGWCITIVSALLAIYASTKNELFILVSILPTVIFWFLDSYYLMQERKFRGLYKDVAGISNNPKNLKLFEMRPDLYIKGDYHFFNVLKSPTIVSLYLPLSSLIIGIYIYLLNCI
jgi:hypothetical protein